MVLLAYLKWFTRLLNSISSVLIPHPSSGIFGSLLQWLLNTHLSLKMDKEMDTGSDNAPLFSAGIQDTVGKLNPSIKQLLISPFY